MIPSFQMVCKLPWESLGDPAKVRGPAHGSSFGHDAAQLLAAVHHPEPPPLGQEGRQGGLLSGTCGCENLNAWMKAGVFLSGCLPWTLCVYLFIHSFIQVELSRPAMCQVGCPALGHTGERANVTAEPTVGRRSKFE